MRGEYETLNVTPTAITFTNVEDKSVYTGTAANAAYKVNLRNGAYQATITAQGYSTTTHVVVEDGAVSRDLLLKDETVKSKTAYTATLYVGADKDYKTVQAAVDAVQLMDRGDTVTDRKSVV